MKNGFNARPVFLIGLMLLVALSRLIPHPPNFTPIGALGLFGATYISRKWIAILLPLMSLWLSSIILDNTIYKDYQTEYVILYDGWIWTSGTIVITTIIGFFTLKRINLKTIIFSAFIASIIFYLITNFGAFLMIPHYSKDFVGLIACYIAAIPFFGGTLTGNIFYSLVMFGIFELAKKRFPQWKQYEIF